MKPRWRLMLFLAVLFCVLLTQAGQPHVIRRRLKDGSTLSLVAITHGTEHRYVHGTISALLFPLLPDWARGEMGQRWDSVTTPTECDVAWFVLDPPGGSWAANPLKIDSYTLYDDEGCEIKGWPISDMYGPTIGEKRRRIAGVRMSPWPKRAGMVGVRFWTQEFNKPSQTVAEFPIPSDRSVPVFPEWNASIPPFTAPVGGARWTLRQLDTNAPGLLENYGAATTPNRRYTFAFLHRDGTRDRDPVWVRFKDAAGEVLDVNPYVSITREGELFKLACPSTLWRHESAYDVEVALSRNGSARFRKEELRTDAGLPVPPAVQAKRAFREFPHPRLFRLSGHEVEVSNPDWSFHGPPALSLYFFVRGQTWPWSRIVVIRVEDDQGRKVELEKDGYVRYMPFYREGRLDTAIEIPVLIKKPAKSLSVTFALDRPKVASFRVRPEQWKATPLASKAAK